MMRDDLGAWVMAWRVDAGAQGTIRRRGPPSVRLQRTHHSDGGARAAVRRQGAGGGTSDAAVRVALRLGLRFRGVVAEDAPVDRQPPRVSSNAIELYIRTYYSLLRSSGDVRVRAFEESHAFSDSSLHAGAREPTPDLAAFAYAAARLPQCMLQVRRLVAGQSNEQFESAGLAVTTWQRVTTRGRRRPLCFDGVDTLAVYVTSASDIDDLVPIVTAWQIEWNKMHGLLLRAGDHAQLVAGGLDRGARDAALADGLGLPAADIVTLHAAFGDGDDDGVRALARHPCDLTMRLLAGTLAEYRRASQRWWSAIEPAYLRGGSTRRPVYFVSSNTHALPNLIGGYARAHRDEILDLVHVADPEALAPDIEAARARGDEGELANLSYYLLRQYLRADASGGRIAEVQQFDAASGLSTLANPGHLDVAAQLVELAQVRPDRLDPRVRIDGVELLAQSDAVIINIDYPLGMAAYHHFTRLSEGVGELRGVYLMGKAATLNGRVGDIMLSTAAYDEHSQNTHLFRNAFAAADVQPWVHGTVLDNQKALTVRGSFLQNREYMQVFYREGYTVLEMETGPYLSGIYELVYPKRHPTDEIVHLSNLLPFDLGVLHYASDTPYSRRQTLLSKSLSYFGMDATYGCAIAILRRIFEAEIARARR